MQKIKACRKTVEMLFAGLKRILGLARLRLHGPCGVQDEFALAATAQALRKLTKLKPLAHAAGCTGDRTLIAPWKSKKWSAKEDNNK